MIWEMAFICAAAEAETGKRPRTLKEAEDGFMRWYYGARKGETWREAMARRAAEPHPTLAMLPREKK